MSVYIWASIYILIELLKYYLCLDVVFNIPIYKRKITVPIWLAVSFVICILYFSFYQYEGIFYLLPVLCFAAIFFAIENKYKLKGILFMILSWIVIDCLSELISQLIAVISGRNDYLLIGFTVNQFIEKFVVLFILVLYHIIINVLIRKKVSYHFYPAQWVVILLSFGGLLLIVPSLEKIIKGRQLSSQSYIYMSLAMMCLLFLFLVVMVWQSRIMTKNIQMREREINYQYMIRSQSEYFENLIKNDKEVRKLRHDMRAHISALREFAYESDDERMLEYLSDMEEKSDSMKAKRYTGNIAVDAVINELKHQMDEKGICFVFDGIMKTRDNISDFELCTIFFNIIQNAIEGCMKVEGPLKSVHVKVKNIGEKIGISVDNDTVLKDIPKKGELKTTKEDSVNHGLGTQNVREVVEKHEGFYVNDIVDGRFVVDIII